MKVIRFLIILLTPIIIVLSVVRLMLTPVFIHIEYHMPNFPKDEFGFTLEDRLYWSDVSRQYLVNDEGIEFLASKTLDDGSPLYNQRELRHMADVKRVVKGSMTLLVISLVLIVGLGAWARFSQWWDEYLISLRQGGMLTIGIIAGVIVFIALSFNTFFVGFHRIFFTGDTWLFYYSDTLIRLFPERFWIDSFIFISIISLLIAVCIVYLVDRRRRIN